MKVFTPVTQYLCVRHFILGLLVVSACTGSVDAPTGTEPPELGPTDDSPAPWETPEEPDTSEPEPEPTPDPPAKVQGCGNSSATFCDDFDSATGTTPQAPWKTQTNGGTVAISTTRAFSGDKSVALTTTVGSGKTALITLANPTLPLPGNHMFGRMMMWLDEAPANSTHWNNIEASGAVEGQGFNANYRYGGQHSAGLMANYDTSGKKSDCWRHSKTKIPAKRWACVEWEFDGPKNTMHFWLDGEALEDITVVETGDGCIAHETDDTWIAPTFSTLRLGWQHYQSLSNEIHMWVDDVALDDQRVGCPAQP